uniref:Uncharacterized protein n=1 Tax=Tetranychus urticae TaxID=32264 RepID=T1K7M3_TETUR
MLLLSSLPLQLLLLLSDLELFKKV